MRSLKFTRMLCFIRMDYKNKILIVTVFVVFFAVAVILYMTFTENKLTSKEIYALRNEYPVVYRESNDASFNVDVDPSKKTGIRKIVEDSDAFVYCEIIGEPVLRKIFIGTGNAELDKEVFENTEYNAVQYHFPIRIISDTEGIFEKGQEITYCYGITTQSYDPGIEIGKKAIIPIYVSGGKNEGLFFSSISGYYYVTDDGYALSAYGEKEYIYSGMKWDSVMKNLTKTEEEREEYFKDKTKEYEGLSGTSGFIDYEAFKLKVKNELIPKNQEMIKSLKEAASAEK